MFSEAIERALCTAIAAHEGQFRKGSETPYVVHPIHVAFLLARYGADEEVIQAGLLHDVVEDCLEWTLDRLHEEFGPRVACIVAELTEDKSRSWEERKRAAIEHAPSMSREAAHVKACDKLHNLQSLLAQLVSSSDPERVWSRFRGGREATVLMDRELVAALLPRVDPLLGEALSRVQRAIQELVGE